VQCGECSLRSGGVPKHPRHADEDRDADKQATHESLFYSHFRILNAGADPAVVFGEWQRFVVCFA